GEAEAEQPFAAEEIDSGIDARGIQPLDPAAEPVEVRLMESGEIEFRLAVRRVAGAGALPGQRRYGEIRRRALRRGQPPEYGQLCRPEQCEIMMMIDKQLHVRRVIQGLDRAVRPPVLEVVPGMRPRQVDRLAAPVGEVVGGWREAP